LQEPLERFDHEYARLKWQRIRPFLGIQIAKPPGLKRGI
jgi:hypothetical protein